LSKSTRKGAKGAKRVPSQPNIKSANPKAELAAKRSKSYQR
jgi:hypothetical protein